MPAHDIYTESQIAPDDILNIQNPEFVGKIMNVTLDKGTDPLTGNPQDRIVVEIYNPTGANGLGTSLYARFKWNRNPRSLWGRWYKALTRCGLKVDHVSDMLGRWLRWQRQDIDFGTIDGKPVVIEDVIMPLELFASEEEALAEASRLARGVTPTLPEDDPHDEESRLATLVAVALDGKTYDEFVDWLFSSEDVPAPIADNSALMKALLDPQRSYIQSLISSGVLQEGQDGRYHFASPV